MDEDKNMTQRMAKFVAAMNEDAVTMKDFKKSVAAVIKQVLKFEAKLKEEHDAKMQEMQQVLSQFTSQIESGFTQKFSALKRGLDGRDGVDGKDGVDGRWGRDGKDGSPDTGGEIIMKINEDKSKKIKKEKVEGLEKLEDDIKTAKATSQSVYAIVGSGISWGTPTGTVDDSNTAFTVSTKPIFIIVNGSFYREGKGIYASYSGGTITLNSPVGTGGFIISAH